MQDLLYSYDSETPQIDSNQNSREDYYKKQFKVKLYLKVVIGVSLFVAIFFMVMRLTTVKKSYVCLSGYGTVLVDEVEPPYIVVDDSTQFYTFIDPSYSLTFHGTFVQKQTGGLFNGEIVSPKVFINDTRFSINYSFDDCESPGFSRHYKLCSTLTISFAINTNSTLKIIPYPIKVFIENPNPSYSMYFNEYSNVGCFSNFTVIVVPLYKQNCYPSITSPLVFCENSGQQNTEKLVHFKLSADSYLNILEDYYPFILQSSISNNNELFNHAMIPTIIDIESGTMSVVKKIMNVTKYEYNGNRYSFAIHSGHHGNIANISFYESIEYDAFIDVTNYYNMLAIPFIYKPNDINFRSAYIAGGFYVNKLNNISFEIQSVEPLSLITISSQFIFYLDQLPIITINDKPTGIYDYSNPEVLPFTQFFRYNQTLVYASDITVQSRENIKEKSDIKSISIKIPNCDGCEYTEFYSNQQRTNNHLTIN